MMELTRKFSEPWWEVLSLKAGLGWSLCHFFRKLQKVILLCISLTFFHANKCL